MKNRLVLVVVFFSMLLAACGSSEPPRIDLQVGGELYQS